MPLYENDAPRRIVAEQSHEGYWSIEVFFGDLNIGSALTTNAEVYQSIRDKQERLNIPDDNVRMKHFHDFRGQIEIPFFITLSGESTREELLNEKTSQEKSDEKKILASGRPQQLLMIF